MFFWMFFKTIFGRDVYSTTEITRLTIQREEFLVLYIQPSLRPFLAMRRVLSVHRYTEFVKKKFNLWRLQAAKINEFEISVSL